MAAPKIEEQALKREDDKASKARLEEVRREISELDDKRTSMRAQWLTEKEINSRSASLQPRSNASRLPPGDPQGVRHVAAFPPSAEAQEPPRQLANVQESRSQGRGHRSTSPASSPSGPASRKMQPRARCRKPLLSEEEPRSAARVVGQEARVAVVNARSAVSARRRSVGSFLLSVPGVGARRSTRAPSRSSSRRRHAMVSDMSAHGESATRSPVSRRALGYVGYEEGGQPPNPSGTAVSRCAIRRNREGSGTLLQVLDDGRSTARARRLQEHDPHPDVGRRAKVEEKLRPRRGDRAETRAPRRAREEAKKASAPSFGKVPDDQIVPHGPAART